MPPKAVPPPTECVPCGICQKKLVSKKAKRLHHWNSHICEHCGETFDSLPTHLRSKCPKEGMRLGHFGPKDNQVTKTFFHLIKTCHRGTLCTYRAVFKNKIEVLTDLFNFVREPFHLLVSENLKVYKNLIGGITFKIILRNIKDPTETRSAFIQSKKLQVRHDSEIDKFIQDCLNKVSATVDKFNAFGSGFIYDHGEFTDVEMGELQEIAGGAVFKLPSELKGRHGLLNVTSKDPWCFLYNVAGVLHHAEIDKEYKLNGKDYLPFMEKFNISGLTFPMKVSDINIFESNNDISISVFGFRDGVTFPQKVCTEKKTKHVDLLLIDDDNDYHYVGIANLSRFLGWNSKNKHFFCRYCVKAFRTESVFEEHLTKCFRVNSQEVTFPDEKHYKFDKWEYTIPFHYVCYYDFETWCAPYREDEATEEMEHLKELRKSYLDSLVPPPQPEDENQVLEDARDEEMETEGNKEDGEPPEQPPPREKKVESETKTTFVAKARSLRSVR